MKTIMRISATTTGQVVQPTCAVVITVVGLSLLAVPVPAAADIYNFTEIASTDGPPFSNFDPPRPASINESGMVAFRARLDGGGEGVYVGDGATISKIADTSELFEHIGDPSINDAGDVAFKAQYSYSSNAAIRFDSANNTFTVIADVEGPFEYISGTPSINNAGVVAFEAKLDAGLRAIAVGNGGAPVYVMALPVPPNRIFSPVISTGGSILEVAFTVEGYDPANTIFKGGSLSLVPVVVLSSSWSLTWRPSINDAGQVLFSGTLDTGVSGVFTGDGNSITTIVNSVGPFDEFGDVAHSNSGSAFVAELDVLGKKGVFTGPDIGKDSVIFEGDSIQGFPSTVYQVSLGPEALNNSGQLVLGVRFDYGPSLILRADPLGELKSVPDGLDAAVAMKTDWNAGLGQVIDTPSEQAELEFEYRFATTTGQLNVKLNDATLAEITAPRTLVHEFETIQIPVDILRLFPDRPPAINLEFTLVGADELSGVVIDDITFPGLLNGDFGTSDLSGWDLDEPPGSAVGVAAPARVPEPSTHVICVIGGVSVVGTWLRLCWNRRGADRNHELRDA